jgi:hypothetical protein
MDVGSFLSKPCTFSLSWEQDIRGKSAVLIHIAIALFKAMRFCAG